MNSNDQRITAYALGELRGAERDAFEAELAASEDLQREFKETLEMIEKIGTLPAPTESLSDEQRASLRDECQRNLKIVRHGFRTRRMIVTGALGTMAACLLIGVMVLKTTERPRAFSGSGMADSKGDSVQRSELALAVETEGDRGMVDEAKEKPPQAKMAAARLDMARDAKNFEVTVQVDALRPRPMATPVGINSFALNAPPSGVGKAMPVADLNVPAASMADAPSIVMSPAIVGNTQSMPMSQTAASLYYRSDLNGSTAAISEGQVATGPKIGTGSGGGRSDKVPVVGDIPIAGRLFDSTDVAAKDVADKDTRDGRFAKSEKMQGAEMPGNETYAAITENPFLTSKEAPLSTFSIDVDTASYANVRRFLQAGQRPPLDAVRIEELVNYFPYSYPQPEGKVPFSVNVEVAQAPWNKQHQLARIALKGREVAVENLPPSNLVFLIDVSGSMNEPNKLPLLKRSLQALVEHLRPQDRVAIVVYAGNSGLVLPSTLGKNKDRILDALDKLQAGGSTNGGAGIKLAYKIAEENFLKEGSNRVILCTDGDFNVGVTGQDDLVKMMERERESGVFISVLGFGTENLKDSTMEKLADKGNGNYSYIDSPSEGRKVLVEQMGGTLFTIAKDVKIQVEFNPAKVAGYRLIGYEKRLLAKEDFNNDKKDAGEIGSGHTVTALYEIVPAGMALPDQPSVDPLKYQKPAAEGLTAALSNPTVDKVSDDLFTVKLRYKAPDGDKSQLIEVPVASAADQAFDKGSDDFQFAAAVAAFGMKLRDSQYLGDMSWQDIQKIARRSMGEDVSSYRAEFLTLVEKAAQLREFQPKPDQGE